MSQQRTRNAKQIKIYVYIYILFDMYKDIDLYADVRLLPPWGIC